MQNLNVSGLFHIEIYEVYMKSHEILLEDRRSSVNISRQFCTDNDGFDIMNFTTFKSIKYPSNMLELSRKYADFLRSPYWSKLTMFCETSESRSSSSSSNKV